MGSIQINGTLIEARPCAAGVLGADALLVFTLGVGQGVPFEARWLVGSTPEARIQADRIARACRKGAQVTVACDQIEPRYDHGDYVHVARGVSRIDVGDVELRK